MATSIGLTDRLALTCSRAGACCHGNMVWLNPWELARLAAARGIAPRDFRDQLCELGGIRLRFDGPPGWRGGAACALYRGDAGCSVHDARPLACRLYPLARTRRGAKVTYRHEGARLPCHTSCPEVAALPHLAVGDYLAGQAVAGPEEAQDAYLDVVQELADGAFVLLLDTGLAASGDRETLRRWRRLGACEPAERAAAIPAPWLDLLTVPSLEGRLGTPRAFAEAHRDELQTAAQGAFAGLRAPSELRDASALMMALALHLARALGVDPAELAARFISTARQHGARD